MLRQRTAASHAQVEATLDLLAPTTTLRRLGRVVVRLHAFFAAAEPGLDSWSAREPGMAAQLDWPRRRRVPHTAADVDMLRTLGVLDETPAVLATPPALERVGTAQALGWLYVAEGSTLGGAIIARRTATLTGALPARLRTFSPYPEGPGPMWRAYGDVLANWVGSDNTRLRDVGDAAVACFANLESWVAPLRDDGVAA